MLNLFVIQSLSSYTLYIQHMDAVEEVFNGLEKIIWYHFPHAFINYRYMNNAPGRMRIV